MDDLLAAAAGLAPGRGVAALHEALLAELNAAGSLDGSKAVIDSSHVRAMKGGPKPARARDRARPGSKHHLITEAHGIPLAVSLTGGHRNDVTQLMPLIEAIPPLRGRRGRPRQRPGAIYADRGYDHDKYRKQVRDKGITPVIARRSTEHGSGLGTYRWVIEQSIALLHCSAACASAGRSATTSTRPSSGSPAPSSAGAA